MKQLLAFLFLQHAKARRHTAFHGKELQQTFAKGVNGLNFETARCFKRTRKQFSCGRPGLGSNIPDTKKSQFFIKQSISQANPFAQTLKQPV